MSNEFLTIFGSVSLSAVLVFLVRNWISERLKASIQHEYEQKLETHKAQLKSQSEIELARIKNQSELEVTRLKAQLEIAAAERNVQYSRVFEKTLEVIAETYAGSTADGEVYFDEHGRISQVYGHAGPISLRH